MEIKKILMISGPTASGKTSLSLEVANQHPCEIVNFDSLLFYKELNIGTAKPTESEMNSIPHNLINITSINQHINAAKYCEYALPVIQRIHSEGKTPILVGGSGFYQRALIKGMYPSVTPSKETIQKSNKLYAEEGIEPFLKLLENIDHPSFLALHKNDHYRIRRAVEFYWTSHYPISEAPLRQKLILPKYKEMNWTLEHCYLDIPKEQHYKIMEERTREMIEKGLIDEVRNLLARGFTGQEKPLQSIGYKETLDYIQNNKNNIPALIEDIFISTRQLAKSQRTWFQSVKTKISFNPLQQAHEAVKHCQDFLKS